MKNNFIYISALFVLSCSNSVELEPVDSNDKSLKTGVFNENNGEQNQSDGSSNGIIRSNHEVKVLKHIPGKRYSYLNVEVLSTVTSQT